MIVAPDEECFYSTILSTYLQGRALRSGGFLFWTSVLGFGMPLPFAQYLYLHPILFWFALLPPAAGIIFFYYLHLLAGLWGIWRWLRLHRIPPDLALLGGLTYLLCAPTLNYGLRDFWPSVLGMWTTLPWVFLAAAGVFSQNRRHALSSSLALGLMLGLLVANGHAGVTPIYVLGAALFVLGHGRSVASRAPWLALAAVIAVGIGAAKIFHVYTEYRLFLETEPGMTRAFAPASLFSWNAVRAGVLKPFLSLDPGEAFARNLELGARIVWFGPPFLLLSLIAAFRRWKERAPLLLAFCGSLALHSSPRVLGCRQRGLHDRVSRSGDLGRNRPGGS